MYTVHASDSSKAYTPASLDEVSTFGFRGEGQCLPSGRQEPTNSLTTRFIALASAADVSCLEISSRTARSRESWSIILKDGKRLYEGPSIRWRRESRGTVVSVRDAFYNVSPPSFLCNSAFLNLPTASNPSTLSPVPAEDHRDSQTGGRNIRPDVSRRLLQCGENKVKLWTCTAGIPSRLVCSQGMHPFCLSLIHS